MKTPLVSVLMPAYNSEKYIGEAIESILNQTYTNFEFIIADDCSTDDTWEIIKKYEKTDKRITAIRNKKNLYIAKNRNLLVKKAKGEYIAWQDSDDVSYLDRLEKQVRVLEADPEIGIVGGYIMFFDAKGDFSVRKYATNDEELRETIFRYSPVAQPTAMVRKAALETAGEYNPAYPPAEDIDMSFRIGNTYKFANIPQPTLRYRSYNESATFTKLKQIELSTIEIRMKNRKNPNYSFSFFDMIYNLLQYISVFIVPPKLKIALFNAIRNSTTK